MMSKNTLPNKLPIAQIIPKKTRIRLILVWMIVVGFMFFGDSMLSSSVSPIISVMLFLVLLATIIAAAFGVVREADELAHRLGEPYGTLILTLSVVAIEVILISAVMLGPGENPTIGKDSIFSVMMIIMNLVIGLCILSGGLKYGEQEYNAQGAVSYLGMIIMLGGIGMMLPNFVKGAGGGSFSHMQAIVLSVLIVVLYGLFLLFQMTRYRHLYVQPQSGSLDTLFKERVLIATGEKKNDNKNSVDSKKEIWIRSVVLIILILPIVLLSHHMAVVVDYGIEAANLPPLLGGILIAVIVFTPESLTAVRAALNNEFQRVVNLCHGAFVSTVGLTIPSILIIGLCTGKTVLFGMTTTETFLFVITLLLSVISFSGKRTTPIVGIMHLVLFAVFMLLVFNP